MPEAIADQVSIHYEITGSGPPLLFLHGLGSSGRDWEIQTTYFSRTNTVMTIDFRGHGESEKPPGPYSIGAFSDDIVAVLIETGLSPVTVVGLSLGGMAGFQLAADHPDLVAKLVAVNALPAFELESTRQRVEIAVRKFILRFMGMRKMGEVLSGRLFTDEDMEEERATMVERWAENDRRAYRASFQAILDWEGVTEAMRSFAKPILLVASDQDYISVEAKQPFVDTMPSAAMVVIENAHHAVPTERPEQFNRVLEDFLS
jgi:pimeloyl-ACP methyl ester carboxylesterase